MPAMSIRALQETGRSDFAGRYLPSKRAILIVAVICLVASPATACEGTRLAALIAASSLGKLETEIHVDEVRSAEGGSWQIFLGTQSGKPVNIVRTDYGEMAQREARLVIAERDAYAIILTDSRYDRPMTDPAMKIASSTNSTFMFCAGVLQRPAGISDSKFAAHRRAAEAARTGFRAREVSDYVAGVNF